MSSEELIPVMVKVEPNDADKIVVTNMHHGALEEFKELEAAKFEALGKLFGDFELLLEAFFKEHKLQASISLTSAVAIWLGAQVAVHGFDQINFEDPAQLAMLEDPELMKSVMGEVSTDWRMSVVMSIFKTMLNGFRATQAQDGSLPADVQRMITRARTRAGNLQ